MIYKNDKVFKNIIENDSDNFIIIENLMNKTFIVIMTPWVNDGMSNSFFMYFIMSGYQFT